jgi:hypothetical protein
MNGPNSKKSKKDSPDRQPLPGQQDFPFNRDDADGTTAPSVRAGTDPSPNGPAAPSHRSKASTSKTDPGAGARPPTSGLLSAARRARDYKREGRGPTRQLEIQLRHTPISGVYFRVWPNPDDEYPVFILKVKNDEDRREVYILGPQVADLPHVAPKVRDGKLVLCVTSTGKVYVWAKTIPDPDDRLGFRIHDALARAGEEARKGWIMINWDSGALTMETPRRPIEDDARWPSGQSHEECYEIAIRGVFIDDPDHPVIRRLDTIAREV